LKKSIKLKSESKCVEILSIHSPKFWQRFSGKNENNSFSFSKFGEISHLEKKTLVLNNRLKQWLVFWLNFVM
jgi:hypothetical protein